MLKDITIGKYYQTDSIIHNLDPRVKLTATIFYIISLFFATNVATNIYCISFLLLIIFLSNIPIKLLIRSLRSILFLIIITFIFNLFLNDGKELIKFGIFKITDNGLRLSIIMSLRLSLLIISSSILTLTTTPKNITDGMSKSMGFLKKIKLPVDEISMMMSIALRFIPTLSMEATKIIKAQEVRGANFKNGTLIKRLKSLIPILVPLFISSFRRAEELATAMEARCYQPNFNRTSYNPLKYNKIDFVAYAFILIYLISIIALYIFL